MTPLSLSALTSLTHMSVGRLNLLHQLTPSTHPRLPQLRKLQVWQAPPRQLLHAMYLLSRDARLLGTREYENGNCIDDVNLLEDTALYVDMEVELPDEAAAALVDMALLKQQIMATRHVTDIEVELTGHYSTWDVATTLGPLGPWIGNLGFYAFPLEPTKWREMEALMRSVRVLEFSACVPTAEMLGVIARSAQIQELRLHSCRFKEEWVVDMAAVRSTPLTMSVQGGVGGGHGGRAQHSPHPVGFPAAVTADRRAVHSRRGACLWSSIHHFQVDTWARAVVVCQLALIKSVVVQQLALIAPGTLVWR